MTELIGLSFHRDHYSQKESEEFVKNGKLPILEWNWNYNKKNYRYYCINPNINVHDMEKIEGVRWEKDSKNKGVQYLVK